MDAAEELELVIKALKETLSTSVYWDEKSARICRDNCDLRGFTPEGILRLLKEYVRMDETLVEQRTEQWEHYQGDYAFRYYAVLPVEEFKHGLFVEFRLVDDDSEFPEVCLVSAHPERK